MSEPTPGDFYGRRVPEQWNRLLDAQEQAAPGDEEATRILEEMRAVDAGIRVIVRDGASEEVFELDVSRGRMQVVDAAAKPTFLTLAHDQDAFAVLERESGDSLLGFIGGLAGLGAEMRLTRQRMDNLAGMEGALDFVLTGEGGFELRAHFGDAPLPDEAKCRIEIANDAYQRLRSGELDAQEAFLSGQIKAEGDMQMAMQLALAAMTPD